MQQCNVSFMKSNKYIVYESTWSAPLGPKFTGDLQCLSIIIIVLRWIVPEASSHRAKKKNQENKYICAERDSRSPHSTTTTQRWLYDVPLISPDIMAACGSIVYCDVLPSPQEHQQQRTTAVKTRCYVAKNRWPLRRSY